MTTTNELLALIDLLEDLLDRSDLAELEVEAGELGILLRKPGQLLTSAVTAETLLAGGSGMPADGFPAEASGRRGEGRAGTERGNRDQPASDLSRAGLGGSDHDLGAEQARPAGGTESASGAASAGDPAVEGIRGHAVIAPLTGVFYGAPSPGAAPYVTVGTEVVAGQVIGLIEAMKLFNEIKSDAAGRVARIHAADGALVRAKEPLIELEPS
ncbi:MAG: acetyl-CoA carboxylase biotin carboxyl carrier protein [Candidatus Limnocylindrales bacterium]